MTAKEIEILVKDGWPPYWWHSKGYRRQLKKEPITTAQAHKRGRNLPPLSS